MKDKGFRKGPHNQASAAYSMDDMSLAPPIPVHLTMMPAQACSYLPERICTTRAFQIDLMSGVMYQKFMNAGFRRCGTIVYQPVCAGCRGCVPIRLEVERFKPDKSQRRSVRLNGDLVVSESEPELTDEKFDLYRRYVTGWHGKDPNKADKRESLEAFLYESPVRSIEFCYRTGEGKLIAVGIADICDHSFSSVYLYFDPAESRRSLGTFGAMHEIDWCRRQGIAFYYLGFWIPDCATMQYKSRFRPAEVLGADGIWRGLVERREQMQ